MSCVKPKKLSLGDTVAIVSPSSGLPSIFPYIYENGLKVLSEWGLKIKEFPAARVTPDFLHKNPQARAEDINNAFADSEVKAIIASIGGNDSVRILPFLDKNIIKSNPKIFMGYSDASTLHMFLNTLGISSMYGPGIMTGFSQMKNLPAEFELNVRKMLFESENEYEYKAYAEYCDGYPDWANKENTGKTNPLKKNGGWHWLQGSGKAEGELFGGCAEVLEMMKATEFWPPKDFWKGKIFFLETSEEKPTLHQVDHILRNYGMLGVFENINGLIFARARDYSDEEKKKLEELIVSIVDGEFGRDDLPIVANFDIGHTDPQFVMPLGIKAEIDCDNRKVKLIEPWLN